jgi:hypothetical protein
MLRISMDIDAGNELSRKGTLGQTIGSIVEDQKPEVAYFYSEGGKRAGMLIVNMENASEIPALAEPWFLACNANVEILPVMRPEDLAEAEPAIKKAVQSYGG